MQQHSFKLYQDRRVRGASTKGKLAGIIVLNTKDTILK